MLLTMIVLRVRDLKSGDLGTAEFKNVDEATEWLRARPPFVEVLGVVRAPAELLSQEQATGLRTAMRSLSPEEQKMSHALDEAEEKRVAEETAKEQQKAAEARERRKAEMKTADPNRIMEINWTFDGGMKITDPDDPREITAEVKDAVMAWIRERDEWVKDRGQIVGEATVKVWPLTVPKGDDRVQSGRFVPVSAPGNN